MPVPSSSRRRVGVCAAALAASLLVAAPFDAYADDGPAPVPTGEATQEADGVGQASEPTESATPSPTTPSPSPSVTPTPPPKPKPKPKKQTVSVKVGTARTLPTIRAVSNSKKRTTFVLQRYNGKRWVSVRTRKSSAKGVLTFKHQILFSKYRVKAKSKSGWTAATSKTANTRTKWRAGYSSLGIKNASVAVTPLGGRSFTVGDHRNDHAWSTIKVPVVVLADARGRGSRADKERALRFSDNAANRRVYNAIGSDRRAALNRHLRKYGDRRTKVSGSGPGLTKWHVTHQSVYASKIACPRVARSARIHMKNAQPSHRFGLLQTKLRARTSQKVGYGGSEVRQLAIVKLRDGRTYGVSILGDGGFRPARDKVDRIARWLANRLEYVPARKC